MSFIQNMAGMGDMTEQIIAADFLIAAKTDIKNYASALSETTSPQLRDVLRRHLNDGVNTQERIINYMMRKNYYDPYNPKLQLQADLEASETVMQLKGSFS